MPISRSNRRPKAFGPGRAHPLDREQKVRVMAYARAWSARHREGRQHTGPITRTFMEVLRTLLWGFHNAQTGRCFPGHDRIAAKVGCCRDTVIEALKVLQRASVIDWEHRLVHIRQRVGSEWCRVVRRTSNAYWFNVRSPDSLPKRPMSENPIGTPIKDSSILSVPPETGWESAARQLRALGMLVPATWGT